MTECEQSMDRRIEPRRYRIADRISWTGEDPSQNHTGWVSDIATSGVAFVTPVRNEPTLGQQIELTFDQSGPCPHHKVMRVVRTAAYDRYFSVVGCAAETPIEHAGST